MNYIFPKLTVEDIQKATIEADNDGLQDLQFISNDEALNYLTGVVDDAYQNAKKLEFDNCSRLSYVMLLSIFIRACNIALEREVSQ